jgi:nucleoid-associated protein YgaU
MSSDESAYRIAPSLRCGTALSVLFLALLGSVSTRAQDVAEAARQERARKAAQANQPHHVYTEEDLKKAQILTPYDVSRALESRKTAAPQREPETEIANAPKPLEEQSQHEAPSLGEVARRYRQEKAARQAEQAAKAAPASRYPLDLPKASLAAPKAAVGPVSGSLRTDELSPVRRPIPRTSAGMAGLRVSPFVPRLAVVPSAPRGTKPLASIVPGLHRTQVQAGDSWWKLARRCLGEGARWGELLRVNPGRNPDPRRLLAGAYVFVPESPGGRAVLPGQLVAVRKGDTLWSLARAQLGCGGAWHQLAAANPQITNVNLLQIGAKLRIPGRSVALCPAGEGPTLTNSPRR